MIYFQTNSDAIEKNASYFEEPLQIFTRALPPALNTSQPIFFLLLSFQQLHQLLRQLYSLMRLHQ